MQKIDVLKIKKAGDYIRYLSLSGTENANSGHPGLPLGCADLGVILYRHILRYNPEKPLWLNRDRFILSAGHGSILLYSLLHCSGYGITLNDIAKFRQIGSLTPGHPEYHPSMGIETTTGPLGQGFANAVGAAIEAKMLAARFNKDGYPLFDYNIYVLTGDGCQMEGISYEAASIAGHLGLDNLIAIYDSNSITIDGATAITFTEDISERYASMGWITDTCDAENLEDMYVRIESLGKKAGKPALLILKTVIGSGLNLVKGTSKIHGTPAGADEFVHFVMNSHVRRLFEKTCGEKTTSNAGELKEYCLELFKKGKEPIDSPEDTGFIRERNPETSLLYGEWEKMLERYKIDHKESYDRLQEMIEGKPPEDLTKKLINYNEEKADSTRNISGRVLSLCAESMKQIVGGSADLVSSTKATIKGSGYITAKDFSQRNIAFGIREHAMGSIGNGLSLGRLLIPFTSTFLIFFDYMKPPVRLAALMKLRHLFIYTHDSIYVGEDGPTHEPVEQLNSLRLIPGLYVFRPANAMETAFSYLYFISEAEGPVAIICSRQELALIPEIKEIGRKTMYGDFRKGAYIVYETETIYTGSKKMPDVILAGSGSEVGLAFETAKMIENNEKKTVRVVSVTCLEFLEENGPLEDSDLFGKGEVPVIFIEAASHRGVRFLYGKNVTVIGLERFGMSGKMEDVAVKLGFTPQAILNKIKNILNYAYPDVKD